MNARFLVVVSLLLAVTAGCGDKKPPPPATKAPAYIFSEHQGKYALTIDDGVNPPLTVPLAGGAGAFGEKDVSVEELLSRPAPSPYRPCPCSRLECRPYCRVLGMASDQP